jgi:hypothetical protein
VPRSRAFWHPRAGEWTFRPSRRPSSSGSSWRVVPRQVVGLGGCGGATCRSLSPC